MFEIKGLKVVFVSSMIILPDMYTYGSYYIDLKNRKPLGFSRVILGGWIFFLLIVVFFPDFLGKITWVPFMQKFNPLQAVFLPIVFGNNLQINVFSLLISSGVIWFFDTDSRFRMGATRYYRYLLFTILPVIPFNIGLSFILKPETLMIAPNLAIAIAWSQYRIYPARPFVWGRYAIGDIKHIPWLIGGGLGVSLLVSLIKGNSIVTILGMGFTWFLAVHFFDRKFLFDLIGRKKKPRLWGMRGGKWGMK
ncbi:MAG: hypothetical protein JXR95_15120 [Deltaproteobacteria bacterium]|nr:hypothetical protein [Deltaproteobacteria bacterium]